MKNEKLSISFKRQSRILAFQAVYLNTMNPLDLDELLLFNWIPSIPPHVYRYAKELACKTIENEEKIINILKKNLKNPQYEDLSEVEKSILKICTCELLYFPKISPAIVINEGIELSKSFGAKNSYKLIHAILDSINKSIR